MDYTNEEKINYMFKELRGQKRSRIIKNLIKLIILGFGVFIYFTYIHGMDKQVIMDNITGIISDIAKPITESIVNDMLNNQDGQDISKGLLEQIKNNPDLLNNIK